MAIHCTDCNTLISDYDDYDNRAFYCEDCASNYPPGRFRKVWTWKGSIKYDVEFNKPYTWII